MLSAPRGYPVVLRGEIRIGEIGGGGHSRPNSENYNLANLGCQTGQLDSFGVAMYPMECA